jgi:multiple sugar transport system permease protein
MGLLQTAKITIPALTFSMLFGLGLALLINRRRLPGRGLIVSLLVTPVMIAPAAVAMMWRLLLQVEYGGVNGLLQYGLGITNLPDWLGNPKTAIWVLSALDVWASTAFVMMILLAGLSSIPEELYEAAKVDGAKAIASFRYITLPLLRTPLIVAFVMRFLSLIRIFDLPFALTAGGPGSSTETVALYTFMVGLRFLRIGDGAAMSLLILFVAFILASLYFKLVPLQKKEKVPGGPK